MSYAPIRPEPPLHAQDYASHQVSVLSRKTPGNTLRPRPKRPSSRLTFKQPVEDYSLIVHSHLGWDWVWQRPQQFVSRLSRRRKVLFVEIAAPDPELAAPLARFRTPEKFPNITLLTLRFPARRWDDGAYVDAERRRLVQEFVAGPRAGHFENPVQWFYDPMAAPAFAGHMGEILTVYDCMDELSGFRYAPPEIIERELALLARADVVFTGGRRLFEVKRRLHDNCHFYGCGVESEHFGQARAAHTAVPAELAVLPKPVLGYFGAVDERMDYELLARLAAANPGWSVVMIGPVIKVEADSLPRRPNLHWLGQRAYADLPAFAKGFDLCLMPFALNEATAFINPTKALEYMAAGREIISTAVPDVVHNFGSVVKIARTREEFITLCRQAIARPDHAAIGRGLKMAGENSWDSIVARLESHIAEALVRKGAAA
jgi:glycosyltransferase involved in cell wall biosynthesis